MKYFQRLFSGMFLVCVLLAPVGVANADILDKACSQDEGAAKSSSTCSAQTSNPVSGENGVLNKGANLLATLTGAVAVIVIIIAGIMYATANGDPGKIRAARDTIIYAVVALVVVLVAKTIITLVTNKL